LEQMGGLSASFKTGITIESSIRSCDSLFNIACSKRGSGAVETRILERAPGVVIFNQH